MKSATALTILAIGAIFAFAVTAHPSFLNIQVLGWVLMLTGITGLVIPRRGKGWLRRSVLVKGSPDFTEVVDADVRKPMATLGTPDSAPTVVDGQVERESIVEYTRSSRRFARGPHSLRPGGAARTRRHLAGHRLLRLARAARQDMLSLVLGRSAPDAVNLACGQGELQALGAHLAASADHLRLIQLLDRRAGR